MPAVTLSVPQRLRRRVFIYYGFHEGPDGHRSTGLDGPGFSEVVFQPCADRPRTVWPGGIRVKGTKPVRLLVQTEGSPPVPLVLGKPHVQPRIDLGVVARGLGDRAAEDALRARARRPDACGA